MEKIIVASSEKTNNPNKYALYIGRWQPFHEGHQWLIDQQLNKGKGVCIAIRDVPKDEKNPWSAKEIQMTLVKKFGFQITQGLVRIIIIPDIDSVNIGRGVGYDIIEHVPPDDVGEISATKIRESMKGDGF